MSYVLHLYSDTFQLERWRTQLFDYNERSNYTYIIMLKFWGLENKNTAPNCPQFELINSSLMFDLK